MTIRTGQERLATAIDTNQGRWSHADVVAASWWFFGVVLVCSLVSNLGVLLGLQTGFVPLTRLVWVWFLGNTLWAAAIPVLMFSYASGRSAQARTLVIAMALSFLVLRITNVVNLWLVQSL
jgi:hypothetical protein